MLPENMRSHWSPFSRSPATIFRLSHSCTNLAAPPTEDNGIAEYTDGIRYDIGSICCVLTLEIIELVVPKMQLECGWEIEIEPSVQAL